MKAMVVEDSRSARAILRQFLEAMAFEVIEAESGQEALDVLRKQRPVDVVLMDWNMPGMDGCEAVRLLRAWPDYKQVPIMMVTTENQLEQVSVALEAGANEYLMKPFDQRALQEKLLLMGLDPGKQAA